LADEKNGFCVRTKTAAAALAWKNTATAAATFTDKKEE
jgi:hypothetical protein